MNDIYWNKNSVQLASVHIPAADDWGALNLAHIDSGVTDTACLGAWVDRDHGVNYREPGLKPIDPVKPDGKSGRDWELMPGHGTKTCGLLCAKASDYEGLLPGLPVVPYRVTGTVAVWSKEQQSHIAQAIEHAVKVNQCEVISISLGFPLAKHHDLWGATIMGEAVDYAYERGVIVVGAGGQGPKPNDVNVVCYPGKFYRAIAVGGYVGLHSTETQKASRRQPKSIYNDYTLAGGDQTQTDSDNSYIDVWAPADPIWRPHYIGNQQHKVGFGDGTSYATPHVAAAAMLWLRKRGPEIAEAYSAAPWMRVEAFRSLLRRTARDLTKEGFSGFDDMRPPQPDEPLPAKGNRADSDRKIIAGGLDVQALLDATLPVKSDLKQSPLARNQSM